MKIEVNEWDCGITASASKEELTPQELALWVQEQEASKKRYIVFPTTALMLSWRANVQEKLPWLRPQH
jgi:hypothetical protein